MPIVDIDGVGHVELDDSFTSMSARDQEKTINEITSRASQKTEAPISSLSDLGGAIAHDFKNPPNELSIVGMAGRAWKAFNDPIPTDPEEMRKRALDIAMTASPLSAGSMARRGLPLAASKSSVPTRELQAGATELDNIKSQIEVLANKRTAKYDEAIAAQQRGDTQAFERAKSEVQAFDKPIEDLVNQRRKIQPDTVTKLGPGSTTGIHGPVSAQTREQALSTENLLKTGGDAYNEARRLDLAMNPQSAQTLSNNIKQTLDHEGFTDYTTPGTFRVIERLKEPKTKMEMTDPETGEVSKEVVSHIKDVLAVRQVLNRLGANPNEKAAAAIAKGKIDTYLENLKNPRDAIYGEDGARAAELVGKGGEGPGNYAAGMRAKTLEKSYGKAEQNAASAGSGANIDNAIRQQAKSLLNSEKKTRGWSQEEKAQLQKIVSGTFVGNAARYLGKLAPTGIVSGGIVGGAGLAGGAPGILAAGAAMAFGFSAKKLADHLTKSEWNKLDTMIRSRSPMGERMAAPLKDWVRSGHALSAAPTIQNYVAFKMAATNLANNLKDIGIKLNPGDLIRTLGGQGPVPAPAENK